MSMGELGIISRLAVNLTNSSYTFASFRKPSASGQISYEKTKEMLELLGMY
jgi:3-dehydroquinate dehydratase